MRNEEQETFSALGVSSDLVAVLDRAGLTTAFPVQRLCIPDALAGRDVLEPADLQGLEFIAFDSDLPIRRAFDHGFIDFVRAEVFHLERGLRPARRTCCRV